MKNIFLFLMLLSSSIFSQNYLSPISSFQKAQPFWSEKSGINPEEIIYLFITDHRSSPLERVQIQSRPNILIFHDIHLLFQQLLRTSNLIGKDAQIHAIQELINQLEGPIKDDLEQLKFDWDTFFRRKAPFRMTKNIAGMIATLHRAYLISIKDAFEIKYLQLFDTTIATSALFHTDFPKTIEIEGELGNEKVSYKITAQDAQLEITFTQINPHEVLLGNGLYKDQRGTRMRQYLRDQIVPLIQGMGYGRLLIEMIHPSHIPVFESIGFVQDTSKRLTMVYHLQKEHSVFLNQSA